METKTFTTPAGRTLSLPALGFGTAPLGNLYRALSEEAAQATLAAAWDAGMRYIDTAPLYGLGLAETRINHFLRGKPRSSYVLSTKIGRRLAVCTPDQRTGIGKFFDVPNRREIFDYTYDGVMRSLEDSLERLGIDRVDILLVHDIDIWTHGTKAASDAHIETLMHGGYKALLKLRDEKVVDAIGAGVNEWEICQTLAEQGDFDVFLLAGRYTLLEQGALTRFLPLCEQRGIGIILGGPFNSGILATGPKPGAYYNYNPAPPDILDRVGRIEAVCARHGAALAVAALQFPLHHPAVVSIIPGGQAPEEATRNVAMLASAIPSALWADLKREGLLHPDAPVPV